MPAKGDRPAGHFLTGRPLAMAPALPEGKPGTAPGPEAAAVPGGVRTVVTERIMWNDLRNGLRAVPGSGSGEEVAGKLVVEDAGADLDRRWAPHSLPHFVPLSSTSAPASPRPRSAPARFAPARFAPSASARVRFTRVTPAPARFAPARFAPARFAPARFAPARFAPSVRARQVRALRVRARQVRALRVRARQVRALRVRAGQVRVGQVRAGQGGRQWPPRIARPGVKP